MTNRSVFLKPKLCDIFLINLFLYEALYFGTPCTWKVRKWIQSFHSQRKTTRKRPKYKIRVGRCYFKHCFKGPDIITSISNVRSNFIVTLVCTDVCLDLTIKLFQKTEYKTSFFDFLPYPNSIKEIRLKCNLYISRLKYQKEEEGRQVEDVK